MGKLPSHEARFDARQAFYKANGRWVSILFFRLRVPMRMLLPWAATFVHYYVCFLVIIVLINACRCYSPEHRRIACIDPTEASQQSQQTSLYAPLPCASGSILAVSRSPGQVSFQQEHHERDEPWPARRTARNEFMVSAGPRH